MFTNARIDRTTVPEGWYCYDFRGTGNDPGELRFIEEVLLSTIQALILMPEKLERLRRHEFGFLDECDMTLRILRGAYHDIPQISYPSCPPR